MILAGKQANYVVSTCCFPTDFTAYARSALRPHAIPFRPIFGFEHVASHQDSRTSVMLYAGKVRATRTGAAASDGSTESRTVRLTQSCPEPM